MKKLLFFFVAIPFFANAQQQPTQAQIDAVRTFFNGYNLLDYYEMRKPMSSVIKLAFSKGMLETAYGATFSMYGKASIISIKSSSANGVAVEFMYEKDSTEKQRMGFMFNNKNKFVGLSNRSVKFQFPLESGDNDLAESVMRSKIDSIVQQKYNSGVFNGCVLVMDKGNIVYKDCVGFADFVNRTALNDSSLFDLASCSKQFTAMATMLLAERGRLNITDNIQKFIPELPYAGITIENLLTHTSGLPDYMELLDKHWDKTKFATNSDVVNLFVKHKPASEFKPGKKHEYSNTGYALLSHIIEKASGLSYSEFLLENIFKPLGMRHSRVYNTRRAKNEIIDNYAYGYVYSDSLEQYLLPDLQPDNDYVIYMDAITGDGTVNSCISDLVIWENALRKNLLVSKSSLDKVFTNAKLNSGERADYGYGWQIQDDEKFERIAHHSGGWPGYSTYTVHFIDKEKSVVILSNNEYINVKRFANRLCLLLMGKN